MMFQGPGNLQLMRRLFLESLWLQLPSLSSFSSSSQSAAVAVTKIKRSNLSFLIHLKLNPHHTDWPLFAVYYSVSMYIRAL